MLDGDCVLFETLNRGYLNVGIWWVYVGCVFDKNCVLVGGWWWGINDTITDNLLLLASGRVNSACSAGP